MVRKKIDNRIRLMIENGIKLGHRSLFVIVGDKGKDQGVFLHEMLGIFQGKTKNQQIHQKTKKIGIFEKI